VRPRRKDDGAAAVEFALVLPILILILFGIIDYGLYFADALDTSSGVSTATRQAIVANFDSTCASPDSSLGDNSGHFLCMVKSRTSPLAGVTYVKVILPTDPKNPASTDTGWYSDGALVVCEATVVKGLTGFVPLPHNGVIRTRLVERIEQEPAAGLIDPGGWDAVPPGGWDSWCAPAT
jgi:hypothetical protein